MITTFLLTFASSPVDVPASAPLPFEVDLQFILLELLHQPDHRVSVQGVICLTSAFDSPVSPRSPSPHPS